MPVLISWVTTKGSILKYLRDISAITGRSGGTTVEMITPVTCLNSRPEKPNRSFTIMAYSSGVICVFVPTRQFSTSSSFSNTPSTTLVLPMSMARSIIPPDKPVVSRWSAVDSQDCRLMTDDCRLWTIFQYRHISRRNGPYCSIVQSDDEPALTVNPLRKALQCLAGAAYGNTVAGRYVERLPLHQDVLFVREKDPVPV